MNIEELKKLKKDDLVLKIIELDNTINSRLFKEIEMLIDKVHNEYYLQKISELENSLYNSKLDNQLLHDLIKQDDGIMNYLKIYLTKNRLRYVLFFIMFALIGYFTAEGITVVLNTLLDSHSLIPKYATIMIFSFGYVYIMNYVNDYVTKIISIFKK